tara:strand:- start:116519 stop:117868 length:1350 start_codon:yes stop_codon:yes gene_type:complete
METLEQLLAAITSGKISALDLMTESLEAQERNRSLNIMITEVSTKSLGDSAPTGELCGLPMVVKDNIAVADLPWTGGSPGLKGNMASADAPCVRLLKEAGAQVIGKANLHELAFGVTSNNAYFGPVKNPFDPTRIAGGSSGGSAAAVAVGIAPFALGTDTGGSGRIPAAFCGVVGYRPTQGRYPTEGLIPLSPTRDTVALFTRSTTDLPRLDAILSRQPSTSSGPTSLRGLRLGIPRRPFYEDLSEGVSAVSSAVLEKLSAAGVVLVEADMSEIAALDEECGMPIAIYESAVALQAFIQGALGIDLETFVPQIASPDVREIVAMACGPEGVPTEVYEHCLHSLRPRLQHAYAQWFVENDVVAALLPTTPMTAPLIGEDETLLHNGHRVPAFPAITRNVRPVSVVGAPSLSLPAGFDSNGMPVGLLLDGPIGSDARLIEIGIAFEQHITT